MLIGKSPGLHVEFWGEDEGLLDPAGVHALEDVLGALPRLRPRQMRVGVQDLVQVVSDWPNPCAPLSVSVTSRFLSFSRPVNFVRLSDQAIPVTGGSTLRQPANSIADSGSSLHFGESFFLRHWGNAQRQLFQKTIVLGTIILAPFRPSVHQVRAAW